MRVSQEDLTKTLEANPDLRIVQNPLTLPNGIPATQEAPSKYRSQRVPYQTVYGWRLFASKKEAEHAALLDMLVKGGQIKGYLMQVPFRLPGKATHLVDFGVIGLDDKLTWEEAKGRDLPMGKLKRRQVEEIYHIKIILV